ncbi:MAG TPA: tetratricopeptide repeat protein [Vicinamibacterales bacterium]|nr:tetratricopeptide repeat protein [Vicinamibacterales bacterium]
MHSRSLAFSAALIFVACVALSARGDAQPSRRAQSPLQSAERAYNEGRYAEVETLTDKLDGRDPAVVVLRARALIARGQYAAAEPLLRPAANKAPAGDAALELGLLQQMLGKPDATPLLQRVAATADSATAPAELARAARALWALNQWQPANSAYRSAAAAAPTDANINTAWGELFLEKYAPDEAMKSFQAVLQRDPTWVPALIGAARALADDNPPQSIAFAKKALAVNPSSVAAHVFLARQAIDDGHHDEARASLQQALTVNPSSLDAHALLAALAYVEDKTSEYEAEVAKTLAIAPSHGDVYREVGELAAHNYRFDDAVALTRRALALDPDNAQALADLGMHLLRTGDEPGARHALDTAFKLDPYNRVTDNLLKMMDALDTFTTVKDGDLIVRMSKDEAPVLQEYALPLAHKALETLSAKYEFTPRGPILIEIFPKHDDFAVRTAGLPGMIGALGATFGRVVTMDSPKARPGEFQWEATLWHELAHVVTLQMSNQRVPRWLTEGISVYEEKRARPEWGREMEVEFAAMLEHGETLKLKDLDAGFTNPITLSLAYYEASLLVEHLVSAYGDAGLRKLLRAYGQGMNTEDALSTALSTNFDQLQVGFDQSLDQQFGTLRRALAAPEDAALDQMPIEALRTYAAGHARSYPAQIALGRALRKAGRRDEAMQAFERAAPLVPMASGPSSPHAQMAEIAREKHDQPRVITELTALVAVDFNNVEAARQLAGLMHDAGIDDPAKTEPVYQRIVAIDPFDADAHAVLGRLAMGRSDPEAAAREFRAVLALGPVDEAEAHTNLAESYFKSGKRADAKKQTLAALEIAPTYVRAQELLLKLADGRQPR